MSRVRTGHHPDDWLDEGEGFARVQGYSGEMVVAASTPGGKNDSWLTRDYGHGIELKKAGRGGTVTLCGRFLKRQGDTCAKRADHYMTSQCKTRAQLDRDVLRKREKAA